MCSFCSADRREKARRQEVEQGELKLQEENNYEARYTEKKCLTLGRRNP